MKPFAKQFPSGRHQPTTTKEQRRFLEFKNSYHDFISDHFRIKVSLTALTGKSAPWRWDWSRGRPLKHLIPSLWKNLPALAQWDPDRKTMQKEDCSGHASGGCLLLRQEKELWTLIAYFSQKLPCAETNYYIYDKDLLSVVRRV